MLLLASASSSLLPTVRCGAPVRAFASPATHEGSWPARGGGGGFHRMAGRMAGNTNRHVWMALESSGQPPAPTPEEMLLEAIGFLKSNEIERARANVLEARRACDRSGGPTAEQTQLLELLEARLPPPATSAPEPTLAEMFPGTAPAPTGESLKLPGTPSMAELAAKAKAKREAAASKKRAAEQ